MAKKVKRGRTATVTFTVTPEEKDLLVQWAAANGKGLGDYCREKLLGEFQSKAEVIDA